MNPTAGLWRRLFPKKRFAWKEPKEFVRAQKADLAARRLWWVQPGLCLLSSAAFMVPWWVARMNPKKDPVDLPAAVAIAIGGGIVMIYALPLLVAVFPWQVEVLEDRISWLHDGFGSCVPFKDVESAEWTTKHGFPVLRIVRKGSKRPEVLLGVASEVDMAGVAAFFESKGLNTAHGPESLPSPSC